MNLGPIPLAPGTRFAWRLTIDGESLPGASLGFTTRPRPAAASQVTVYDRPFGRYLEDFVPGDIYRHWPGKTITEYDDHLFCMITMNHHPLHTNAWFAEHETVQGKNVVVGNLVYSLALGMSVPDVSGSCIANLEVESLLHRSPTFHGDTIYAETRVLEATPSKSKDDRGIVTVETKAFNQHGDEVCYFRRKLMVWKTADAPAAAPLRRRRLGLTSAVGRPGPDASGTGCSSGGSTGAISRGAAPATRGRSSSARSCCSRPRPTGSSRTTSGSSAPSRPRRRAPPPRPADVVRLWSGLGYNRRALQPAPGGAAVVGRPRRQRARTTTRPAALPGVGPYTARAVRTFAFGHDVAAVDTNGVRVLARCVGGA